MLRKRGTKSNNSELYVKSNETEYRNNYIMIESIAWLTFVVELIIR